MSKPTPAPEQEMGFNEPTPEALAHIPRLSETKNIPAERKIIHLHFVLIHADWYVAEFDGKDTFFGFVDPGDPDLAEWSYFRLSELRNARVLVPVVDIKTGWQEGVIPVAAEHDAHWQPTLFGQVNWRGRP